MQQTQKTENAIWFYDQLNIIQRISQNKLCQKGNSQVESQKSQVKSRKSKVITHKSKGLVYASIGKHAHPLNILSH